MAKAERMPQISKASSASVSTRRKIAVRDGREVLGNELIRLNTKQNACQSGREARKERIRFFVVIVETA
ncbi:MAG TPA: hypothetical protein VK780_05450 [Thermoanaerobaculia bacterium]|nr:hypothetical protein [Thermoanaerobaculia bacterium]